MVLLGRIVILVGLKVDCGFLGLATFFFFCLVLFFELEEVEQFKGKISLYVFKC